MMPPDPCTPERMARWRQIDAERAGQADTCPAAMPRLDARAMLEAADAYERSADPAHDRGRVWLRRAGRDRAAIREARRG